ncbi:MAG TPA: hypothetical protein DDW36_03115 [Candidatus Magasanikbacteria bacterium]|nr:hypothetical protein [Candidatus Magasanikbacteria bacterium]
MNNRLNRLFWFTDPKQLDITKDKTLIIHHTLAFGSVEDIRYLFRLYSKQTIKRIFKQGKKGLYPPPAFAFARQLFNLPMLNPHNYIKHVTA